MQYSKALNEAEDNVLQCEDNHTCNIKYDLEQTRPQPTIRDFFFYFKSICKDGRFVVTGRCLQLYAKFLCPMFVILAFCEFAFVCSLFVLSYLLYVILQLLPSIYMLLMYYYYYYVSYYILRLQIHFHCPKAYANYGLEKLLTVLCVL